MIEDQKLSERYSLYDLTATSHADLQNQNRELTEEQIQKLRNVAGLVEVVCEILLIPVTISSGYRCKRLNDREGSNDRSQHLKCEAADLLPIGMDVGDAFRKIWKQIAEGKLEVGQLIFETASRSYGAVSWIHISLGAPWREQSRCNQVLRMQQGVYTLLPMPGYPHS